jgi:hypothetical protein
MMSKGNSVRDQITEQVQFNCHLSDAHHARDYSLCIYLLKMREFYRWEQGIDFGERLPKQALGEWLTAREAQWEEIEERDFQPLQIANNQHHPFHSERINLALQNEGLVYSGGYCGDKPHFFLAELERVEQSEGANIYICGHELARELTAPPAMSLGTTVFLRRESLRRMVWEKLEEWGWQDPDRAIARAASYYDFENHLNNSLDGLAEDELETLLQHELGEIAVGRELGPDWESMLTALPRSRAQFQLRAIRDHLVDCQRTLPHLLAEGREAAIHFYFANFTTMRKAIFPELGQAYRSWLSGGGTGMLVEAIDIGSERWRVSAEQALQVYREVGDESGELMRRLNQTFAE